MLAAILIAANWDPLPSRAQARRTARAEQAQPNPSPSTSPATFGTAWSNLVAVIDTARSTGDIEEHAAGELSKHAAEMADAYQEGDAEKLSEAISKFEEELGKAVEEDEISSSAADALDQAFTGVVVALQDEGALATASPSPPEEGGEDSSGSGPGSEGNGPPAHAEANGHDED